jgi:hypothetical protein
MARKAHTYRDPLDALRTIALRYPEAEEGIACAGTAAERRTIKARNKAFVFLGRADIMVKLRGSLPEASALAAQDGNRCKAGANGWVKLTWSADAHAPVELLARWIDESYRLLAPKQLVALLPAGGVPTAAATVRAKKAPMKKAAKEGT